MVSAQEDLDKLLDEPKKSEKVFATFKTTRIVNAHSIETVKKGALDFRVSHKFGDIGGSNGGVHSLYGLDEASNIRIAFEYGVCDKLTMGFGRSKIQEALDGYLKYRLLQQTVDNKMPVSITLLANTAFVPQKNVSGDYTNTAHRFSYTFQAMIARKISNKFSLQLMPTMVHRNYIRNPKDNNDLFSLGIGGRLKLSKRFALLADYFYTSSKIREIGNGFYFPPLGIGFEIETGGHVFHLFFTNSAGIIENHFIPNTTSAWNKGQFKFGFNISRVFGLNRK